MVDIDQCYKIYLELAEKRISNYELNSEEEIQIKKLLNYFIYNQGEYETTKGLLIRGNVGVGKTLCFKIIQQMIPMDYRFKFTTSNQISVDFENDSLRYDKFRKHDYLIDDLGTENAANIYGKKEEVLSSFILNIYNNYQNTDVRYHFTTNATDEELLNKYGERAIDRLKEMTTAIAWVTDESKRTIGIKAIKPSKKEEKKIDESLIDLEVFNDVYQWLLICKNKNEYQVKKEYASGYVFDFLQKKNFISLNIEKKKSILNDSKRFILNNSIITSGMMRKDYESFKNGCEDYSNHYYSRAITHAKNESLKYWVESEVLTNRFNIEKLNKK